MTRHLLVLAAFLALLPASSLGGQASGHSTGEWKRAATENFLFLYPAELEGWALPMAERMEAVREAVRSMVGYAPDQRVTVLVDDPSNVSNGSMNPGPLLFMWPTPPGPRSMIGENRGWGEILAVHEFAHAAHLTRPSRNPWERLREALLPIPVYRIMWSTPRWATEGYATYVEGRLTGAGRPHGVWRPAVLRTWALEGQLPTYGQVSSTQGYYGGAFAYLAGSAFLEWLVEREGGEDALPDVWARLTAREQRGFGGAFAGVFGAPPAELYGLFTVDITASALAVRDAIEAAGGPVEGELFQRLEWSTGDPAVSPDGERLAVVLRSREGPSRVVVMSTTPDTLPTRVRERQARILERDPGDVAAVQRRPRAQRAEATLWPQGGAPYDAPSWLPDGSGLLVVRSDFIGNGRTRTDLFRWDPESGDVRRVTRGQGIREARAAADGSWAAGLRCLHARCDIVRIDLATGDVSVIAPGDPLSPWAQPRLSPDGRTLVASRQDGPRWRLMEMGVDGAGIREIGPDDGASRFDAAFLADGETLVLTSTAGGIPQIEMLDRATGQTRTVTRVTGAAVAPSPMPDGGVFFLSLHSRGWDLRRIATDAPGLALAAPAAGLTLAAAVAPVEVDTFQVAPVGPVRRYGLGPRSRTLLPVGIAASQAYSVGAVVNGTDPIGMLSWQLRGMYGEELAFRGGAADVVWRGLTPDVRLGGFVVGGPVPDPGGAVLPVTDDPLRNAYVGGLAELEMSRVRVGSALRLVLGGSMGEVAGDRRTLAWADARVARTSTPGRLRVVPSLAVNGATGWTGDDPWTRWLASGSLFVGRTGGRSVTVSGTYGQADVGPGSREGFAVGGPPMLLLEPRLLGQRIAMPALPPGFLRGEEVWTASAEVGAGAGRFFYWVGDAAGDGIDHPFQVVGIETGGDLPAIHYFRLPASRARLGVARLLDAPLVNEWRAWAMIGFVP